MPISSTQWEQQQAKIIRDGFSTEAIISGLEQVRLNQRNYYCEEIEARWELFHNRSYDITWSFLQQYYPTASAVQSPSGSYQLFPILFPVVSKIIHHLALTFITPPSYKWTLKDGTPAPDAVVAAQERTWKVVCDQINLSSKLRRLDEMTWLCSTAFAVAGWRRGKPVLDIHLPSDVYCIEGSSEPWDVSDSEMVCILPIGKQQSTLPVNPVQYMRWGDDGSFALKDLAGNVLPNSLFPNGRNEYKDANGNPLIPVQAWHLSDDEDVMYPDPDEVLFWSQINVNLTYSDVNNALRKSSYGQYVLKTDNPTLKTRSLEKGVDVMWRTAADDEIINLSATVDPAQQIARIKSLLEGIASAYDIPYDEWESKQSALAKLVGRYDLRLNSLRMEGGLLSQAAKLYEIIQPVYNYHTTGAKLNPDLRLEVIPGRIQIPKDELHAAQADERYYAANRKNPIEDIMQDKGINEAEATAKYRENKAINEGLKMAAPDPETPITPSIEE